MDMIQDFPEAQSVIFPYFNGSKTVYGDPGVINNRYLLQMANEDLSTLGDALRSADPAVRIPAVERMVEAVTQAFQLAPFDPATGEGMTANQVERLWQRFIVWQDSLVSLAKPNDSSGEPVQATVAPDVAPELPSVVEQPRPLTVA